MSKSSSIPGASRALTLLCAAVVVAAPAHAADPLQAVQMANTGDGVAASRAEGKRWRRSSRR